MTVFFAFVFLLFSSPVLAATIITFDAESSTSDGSTSNVNFNHTIGGGCANPIVVVSFVWYPSSETPTVTIGGGAATTVNSIVGSRAIFMARRTGLSGVVAVNIAMSGTIDQLLASARSYCNVHQSSPTGTSVTAGGGDVSGAPNTVDVSSATDELVIDAIYVKDDTGQSLTADAGQTERFNQTTSFYFMGGESDKAGAAGTTTMSWTQTADLAWGLIGVSLKPAAAAATGARRRLVVVQ